MSPHVYRRRRNNCRRAAYPWARREPNALRNPERPLPASNVAQSARERAEHRRMSEKLITHLCGIHSNQPDLIQYHVIELRRSLKSGIPLPRFLNPVRRLVGLTGLTNYPQLQLEAARLLAAIAIHSDGWAGLVLEAGACRIFGLLLLNASEQTQLDAACAVKKLSEGDVAFRDRLIEQGVVPFLAHIVYGKGTLRNLWEEATHCLRNLLRHPDLPAPEMKGCLPILRDLLVKGDQWVKVNVCEVLVMIIARGEDPYLGDMVNLGCISELAHILNNAVNKSLLYLAMDILGLVVGRDKWPELVYTSGVLKGFRRALSFPELPISKIGVVTNSLALVTHHKELAQEAVSVGLFPYLARYIKYNKQDVQMSSFHALYNIIRNADKRTTRLFLEDEMMNMLVDLLLNSYAFELREYALLTLERVVDASKRLKVHSSNLWEVLGDMEVLNYLEQMQWTDDDEINDAAKALMEASLHIDD
ncbi:importin subunit alpha-1-like [Tropilaelaps mercedesae]|uniref:Importin subunit alpha-1-like n=1 Tax=Tropilaelaps mercedesae TaxID=418985 RepID=A0A1V9WYG7_9ACAR|nr:importin subunit alpha-1-like [Tropilaelaps mercedesae]